MISAAVRWALQDLLSSRVPCRAQPCPTQPPTRWPAPVRAPVMGGNVWQSYYIVAVSYGRRPAVVRGVRRSKRAENGEGGAWRRRHNGDVVTGGAPLE
eukprot:641060-Pleurochrysis_carterae.AAC.1